MNRIDFSNLGGLPFTQNRADFMQQSYRDALAALANLCGDKTILYGVQVNGSSVSDGWIAVNGEPIKFVGGAVGAQVVITETGVPFTFADNTIHNVQFTKVATCGAVGSFPFSDLKPVSIVPSGIISMWSGSIANIPGGWALCDGTNGTPDLRGKFIVGYDAGDDDYDTVGNTGGAKTSVLQQTNLPPVQIDVPIPANDTSQGQTGSGNIVLGSEAYEPVPGPTLKTAALGNGTPFETRPSYYTLAYIIKL